MNGTTSRNGSGQSSSGQSTDCPEYMSFWTIVFIILMAYLVLFVVILLYLLIKRLLFGKLRKKRIKRVWNHHKYHHYLHPYCHRSIHTGRPCHHHSEGGQPDSESSQPSTKQDVKSDGSEAKDNQKNQEGERKEKDQKQEEGERKEKDQKQEEGKDQKKISKAGRSEVDDGLGVTESEQSISENDRWKHQKDKPIGNGPKERLESKERLGSKETLGSKEPLGSKERLESKERLGSRDVPTRTHPLLSNLNYGRNGHESNDKNDPHKGQYPTVRDPIN